MKGLCLCYGISQLITSPLDTSGIRLIRPYMPLYNSKTVGTSVILKGSKYSLEFLVNCCRKGGAKWLMIGF